MAQPWQDYAVDKANFGSKKCERVHSASHVAHVDHALAIIRSGRIATSLVTDGLLSSERVTVSWWSPNGWWEGYLYGNVEFAVDADRLLAMNAFWVESRPAGNTVVRILLSQRAAVGNLPRYDPAIGDGPWWCRAAGEHYCNATVQLQFLIEPEITLGDTAPVAFVDHHENKCHLAPGSCRDLGIIGQHGSSLLLAGVVAQGIDGRPTQWDLGRLMPPMAWLQNALDSEGADMMGPVRSRDATAVPLARAVMHAYWQRDEPGAAKLRSLFWSDWDWRIAVSAAVRRIFAIPGRVNLLRDWGFTIKRQVDSRRGCIPACAISVLEHAEAALPMTEEQLVEAMWPRQASGSGFERLRVALNGVADVQLDGELRGTELADRLRKLTFTGEVRVLVAVNKPADHCLLVEAVDATSVRYYDPGDGRQHKETLVQFLGRTADDIAVVTPTSKSPGAATR